jgi:Ca-activated chloride channel family protein
MLTLSFELSRNRIAAGQGHDLDVLVRVRAPAPPEGAKRAPVCVLPLVDISGSMEGAKLAGVQIALRLLAGHLQPGDFLGLATFHSEAAVAVQVAELTEERRKQFLAANSLLCAQSNTNLADGLLCSVRELQERRPPEGVRARVIALTDGQANCGPAVTAPDLCALVKERFGSVSLSAFGYGDDCDQALLGDLAEAGGGSFAHVTDGDTVLTAFARELGGLVSTCAADVRLKLLPLAGAPSEERLGDVLFHGEASTVFRVAAPVRGVGVATPIATLEASWRGSDGKPQQAELLITASYVPAAEADTHDQPAVARAHDERLLRDAQGRAEAAARHGEFGEAARLLTEVATRLRDPALAAFVRADLLPNYLGVRAYHDGSSRRATTYQSLKGKRVVSGDDVVLQRFGRGPSAGEVQMERVFREAAAQPEASDPAQPPGKPRRTRKPPKA